jgi:hypothetical protein
MLLAAALVKLGRLEEAKAAAVRVLELQPAFRYKPAICRRGLRAGACRFSERGAPRDRAAGITLQFYYACTVCRSPPYCKVPEFKCFVGDRMTRRELIAFVVRSSGSTSRNEKRAQALAIGTREDIIMLDKAPNGKVSELLSALDKALSAGEVERAVDLFQTDCYWRDLVTFT